MDPWTERRGKGRPSRLPVIFQKYDLPLYFVTVCTLNRQRALLNDEAHDSFRDYAVVGATSKAVAVGRYVMMPDHLHFFVRGNENFVLSTWVRGLKRAVGEAVRSRMPGFKWQRGFFDHLLRNSESYAQKWEYVRQNPVRSGLVEDAADWPFAGEIVRIDRV